MNRVVVTGMGVVSPVGNDVSTFWENIKAGKCGIGPITKFDTADFKVKVAGEVRDFDPRRYMEKLDVLHSDIYTQFAMAAACQAMADSDIEGTVPPERMGVYIGTGIGGIATFMAEHKKLLEKGPRYVSPFFIPMMIANMAAGMISMRFQCRGPAMPAVTACASGGNAIGEAMRLIRHGYADAMIAGGAEATVNPLAAAGFRICRPCPFLKIRWRRPCRSTRAAPVLSWERARARLSWRSMSTQKPAARISMRSFPAMAPPAMRII